MKRNLVISFIGEDQPGLVRSIATAVREHDGNWLESRMSQLAGRFAGVAVVEAEADALPALRKALDALPGISALMEEAEPDQEVKNTRILELNIVGPDRPGIVFDVTRALEANVANVVEMETRVAAAPMSGDLTFSADVTVEIPFEMDWQAIAEQLDEVAEALGVDILLEEEPGQ